MNVKNWEDPWELEKMSDEKMSAPLMVDEEEEEEDARDEDGGGPWGELEGAYEGDDAEDGG